MNHLSLYKSISNGNYFLKNNTLMLVKRCQQTLLGNPGKRQNNFVGLYDLIWPHHIFQYHIFQLRYTKKNIKNIMSKPTFESAAPDTPGLQETLNGSIDLIIWLKTSKHNLMPVLCFYMIFHKICHTFLVTDQVTTYNGSYLWTFKIYY